MKPVKAIDLVWKAQPMIATLHTIMESIAKDKPNGSAATLSGHCTEWLRDANTLLARKGAAMSDPVQAEQPKEG